jgi:uncharacterized protein YndB with AHSA1/START domain
MNILFIILVIIASLIAIVLILALFLEKDYTIEEEIVIQKPKDQVFQYLKVLKHQTQYNKWVMQDPEVKIAYMGTDGTEGFLTRWESADKKVGKGEQTIRRIVPGKQIEYDILFIEPFAGTASSFIKTNEHGFDSTNVKWSFSCGIKYPLNIMVPLFRMKEMLRKDIATSLENLKSVLEK